MPQCLASGYRAFTEMASVNVGMPRKEIGEVARPQWFSRRLKHPTDFCRFTALSRQGLVSVVLGFKPDSCSSIGPPVIRIGVLEYCEFNPYG